MENMNKEEIENIRSHFPILERKIHGKKLVYLDSAASTLKCQSVIDSIHKHYSCESSNIHRGVHFLSENGTRKYEETRREIQTFLNAKHSHEIIFTKGTTESINLVAESFGQMFLKKGDQILLSTMEHHSNIVPWQLIAQKTGAEIIEIPITDSAEIDEEAYQKLLGPKVKIVSMVHISNAVGTINPIKNFIKLAHLNNSKFFVDAAQSVAHGTVDVQDLDCDFLAFSSHKIFGPTGVGILYGKEKLLDEMPPYQGGGDMIDIVTLQKTTYNDLPFKFEAGTPHIAGVIALREAIKYVSSLGLSRIKTYEDQLLDYATKELEKIDGLKIIGTAKNKASVISFTIEGAHPHDLGTLLDKEGIAIRTGHHCTQPLMKRFNLTATARASFSIYNTIDEVEKLTNGIRKIKTFF